MLLLLLSLIGATPDTLELTLSQALEAAMKHSPARTQASVSRLTSGIRIGQGINALATSAVLFLIFATVLGGLKLLGSYGLPAILILLGVYIIARGIMRSRRVS